MTGSASPLHLIMKFVSFWGRIQVKSSHSQWESAMTGIQTQIRTIAIPEVALKQRESGRHHTRLDGQMFASLKASPTGTHGHW